MDIERDKIVQWQKNIEVESNKLFERKQELEKHYNHSVDFYCKKDGLNIKVMSDLQFKVSVIKRFQILRA